MEDKIEMFRKQMEEMKAKGFGFMMVGTDDPKEAAEIMKVAADVMRPKKLTKVTDIGYALGKNYDETEFDTWDEAELAEIWWEYCKENNLICIEKKEIEEEDE